MGYRYTLRDAEGAANRVRLTMGAPELTWTRRADGRGSDCVVGAVALERGSLANGISWKIVQMVNAGGGERILISAPTIGELVQRASAYCDGWDRALGRMS